MAIDLKAAVAGGGGWLIGLAMVAGLFIGEQAQPVDNLVPSSPAGQEVAFNPCPSGWEYTEEADHVRVLTCALNGWVVSLNADFSFNNGFNTRGPGSTTNPAEVPGWR